MLSFAIPTWNRAEHLELCVRSIADQAKEFPGVFVCVYDNCCDDGTPELLKRLEAEYQGVVKVTRGKEHYGFAHSFQNAFLQTATEWTWTMGDDDILMPGAIEAMLPFLAKTDVDFIHISEVSRSTGSNAIITGTMFELCCSIGFIEYTGFISANICRTKYLKQAFTSADYDFYANSSYPQSVALFEVLRDRECTFIDAPLIGVQPDQTKREKEESATKPVTIARYNQVVDGLCLLRDKGLLPDELPEVFFRYLGGSLFSKIMYILWYESEVKKQIVDGIEWERLYTLAGFLPSEPRLEMCETILRYRSHLSDYLRLSKLTEDNNRAMYDCLQAANPVRYPDTYISGEQKNG